MLCGGEEDLGGKGWEAVEMVLWVRVVDTEREVFWGAVEGDVIMFLGDEGSLGVKEAISEALGRLKDSLEEVFEEEFIANDGSTEVDTDSEHLGDRR